MAWAGILNTTIIGPFFFDANVSGETYVEMLTDYILPEIHRRGFDSMDICYMHDGAPAHIPSYVRQCLDDNFSSWIGRGEGTSKLIPWPPRSPNLNMLDFFLWGVLQHRVNVTTKLSDNVTTIMEVQNGVIDESRNIRTDQLGRVQENLVKRLRRCIQEKGELFEHLLK